MTLRAVRITKTEQLKFVETKKSNDKECGVRKSEIGEGWCCPIESESSSDEKDLFRIQKVKDFKKYAMRTHEQAKSGPTDLVNALNLENNVDSTTKKGISKVKDEVKTQRQQHLQTMRSKPSSSSKGPDAVELPDCKFKRIDMCKRCKEVIPVHICNTCEEEICTFCNYRCEECRENGCTRCWEGHTHLPPRTPSGVVRATPKPAPPKLSKQVIQEKKMPEDWNENFAKYHREMNTERCQHCKSTYQCTIMYICDKCGQLQENVKCHIRQQMTCIPCNEQFCSECKKGHECVHGKSSSSKEESDGKTTVIKSISDKITIAEPRGLTKEVKRRWYCKSKAAIKRCTTCEVALCNECMEIHETNTHEDQVILLVVQGWEMQICECPEETPTMDEIMKGESQLRCSECLKPYYSRKMHKQRKIKK